VRDGKRRRLPLDIERQLVLAAEDGDADARDHLVEAFMPLIGSVARIYRSSRALERYDPTRGTPFWAYASWWVRQAMQQLVSELTRPVVLSDRALRQLARVKDARREYLQAYSCDPSSADLAESTGLNRDQVDNLLAVERAPRGLEEPVGDDDGTDAMFGELIADPVAEDAYERVDRRLQVGQLPDLPSELCEREQTILRARFGLDGRPQTLREVAGRLGLSAERVRQIEARALEKLRAAASPEATLEQPLAA